MEELKQLIGISNLSHGDRSTGQDCKKFSQQCSVWEEFSGLPVPCINDRSNAACLEPP